MKKDWYIIKSNEDNTENKLYYINGDKSDIQHFINTDNVYGTLSDKYDSDDYIMRKYSNGKRYDCFSLITEVVVIEHVYRFALLYENTRTKLRYEREKVIVKKEGMSLYNYVWDEGKRLELADEHLMDVRLIEKIC